jgi:hypothetical protein
VREIILPHPSQADLALILLLSRSLRGRFFWRCFFYNGLRLGLGLRRLRATGKRCRGPVVPAISAAFATTGTAAATATGALRSLLALRGSRFGFRCCCGLTFYFGGSIGFLNRTLYHDVAPKGLTRDGVFRFKNRVKASYLA